MRALLLAFLLVATAACNQPLKQAKKSRPNPTNSSPTSESTVVSEEASSLAAAQVKLDPIFAQDGDQNYVRWNEVDSQFWLTKRYSDAIDTCAFMKSGHMRALRFIFEEMVSVQSHPAGTDKRAVIMDLSTLPSQQCDGHPLNAHNYGTVFDLLYYTKASSNCTQNNPPCSHNPSPGEFPLKLINIWKDNAQGDGFDLDGAIFDWERNHLLWKSIHEVFPEARLMLDTAIVDYVAEKVKAKYGDAAKSELYLYLDPDGDMRIGAPHYSHSTHTHVMLGEKINWDYFKRYAEGNPSGDNPAPSPSPRIGKFWMSPSHVASLPDYLTLFRDPSSWATARASIGVFQFNTTHLEADSNPNSVPSADLRKASSLFLVEGIRTALEAPAIKEWDCTTDTALAYTKGLRKKLYDNGGKLNFIAMDEPLFFGTLPAPLSGVQPVPYQNGCGFSVAEAAQKIAKYIENFRAVDPTLVIGDVEPWPALSKDALFKWMNEFRNHNGFELPFLHLDVNLHLMLFKGLTLQTLVEVRNECVRRGISFGIIVNDGQSLSTVALRDRSDRVFYDLTMRAAHLFQQHGLDNGDIIIQSWEPYPRTVTPDSLSYSFTNLVRDYANKEYLNYPADLGGSTPPAPPAPSGDSLPVGFLDVANTSSVAGWAYDADVGTSPVLVHIYVDGVLTVSLSANQSRPDVNSVHPGYGDNHGFVWAPTGLSVGVHTIRAFAINAPTGVNPELAGSPKTITVAAVRAATAPPCVATAPELSTQACSVSEGGTSLFHTGFMPKYCENGVWSIKTSMCTITSCATGYSLVGTVCIKNAVSTTWHAVGGVLLTQGALMTVVHNDAGLSDYPLPSNCPQAGVSISYPNGKACDRASWAGVGAYCQAYAYTGPGASLQYQAYKCQ